jgi:hypothetical protein
VKEANMRKVIICAAALLLFSSISFSQDKTVTYYQDGASNPPDLVISLKYLRAEVSFEPAGNLVYGNAEFTFTTNRYN